MTLPAAVRVNAQFPFPSLVQGKGGISVSKSGGIWTIAPNFSALAQIPALSNPATKEIWVFDPLTGIYSVMTLGALGQSLLTDTSSTSLAINTGTVSFIANPGKAWTIGSWIIAASSANAANYMVGQVTGYATVGSVTTLTLNVTSTSGGGTHADWNLSLSGPTGPTLSYFGTSTTSLTVGGGPQTLTTQTGLSFNAGQFVSITSSASPSNWMVGQVTSYNSGTGVLVANVTDVNGSGTLASWNINIAGNSVTYSGTSTTSLTIGTGPQTLTTLPPGLSYVPGQFVSLVAAADATKWMTGTVTSYNQTTGSLVVSVTSINGSGTFASWLVNISGAPASPFIIAGGSTTLNFGAAPGATDAQTIITGQTGIVSGSQVEAWITPAATADHSIDEHWVDPPAVYAGNIIAGTGFTIYGVARQQSFGVDGSNPAAINNPDGNTGNTLVYGLWSVNWRWQ